MAKGNGSKELAYHIKEATSILSYIYISFIVVNIACYNFFHPLFLSMSSHPCVLVGFLVSVMLG